MPILIYLTHPENGPMLFTTVDGRDWTAPDVHKRNVTVTLVVGDPDAPAWEGVIARGYHTHSPQ
jgi:hypothetical protein